MAVLIEGISVVARRRALATKFEGGWEGFLRAVPNRTLCVDEGLARVGFMSPEDARVFVEQLTGGGLEHLRDGICVDLSVVEQDLEPSRPTPWLVCGTVTCGLSEAAAAWLAGEEPGELAVPEGWTQEGAQDRLQHLTLEDVARRLVYLRHDAGLDVFQDRESGRELYLGRTSKDTGSSAVKFRLKGICRELLALEAELGAMPASGDESGAGSILQRFEDELEPEARRIADSPWHAEDAYAQYVHGLALRMLKRWEDAERAYRRAYVLHPKALQPLLELVLCLGSQGRGREALPFAEKAVQLDPTHVGALGNLAACLLENEKIKDAAKAVDRALALDPTDEINLRIKKMIHRKRRRWWKLR